MDGQVRKETFIDMWNMFLHNYVFDCFALKFQELNGRNIRVSYANERPSGPRSFGGNNGGFRGDRGFGGDSGY